MSRGIVPILLICFVTSSYVYSQNRSIVTTNKAMLYRIAQEMDSLHKAQMSLVSNYSKNSKYHRHIDGGLVNGTWVDGSPKILIDHNTTAGIASRVNQFYSGGRLGQSITGKSMTAGVWEIGAPLADHIEYVGRLNIRDQAEEVRNHATHVSGTVIASGLNPEARGMAFEANADVYSASGYLSEIATAAAEGLLVSNHSYGSSAGYNSSGEWLGDPDISTQEDWKFGIYDSEAATLDQIAYNAPYYLLIRSAGNERGESGSGGFPPDGPYDCMTGEANAKNILSVGNARSLVDIPQNPGDIELRASSSWGPTDDGRIKPEIVAVGTNLLSASSQSSNSYTQLSGTSMSSPVITGTSLLLQQLHERQYGVFMRSATLKGLLLHTTLEAGSNDGPDYSYGFGFMDAQHAARVISEKTISSIIEEEILEDGAMYNIEFEVADNTDPLVVSLSWTDPQGVPVNTAVLDPTDLKLINDLDIRVIGPNDDVYEPWILNPSNPPAAATKGDNFRDNYEKIEILNPTTGTYSITVSHKATLTNGEQPFSLIVSNIGAEDKRQTFYWIGGNGSWNDPSNWSLSSGGSAASEIPTSTDRVVFDENGLSNNQIVTLNADASVHQINWLLNNGSKVNFNGNTLSINKSAEFSGPISTSTGKLDFSNTESEFINLNIDGSNPELIVELDKINTTLLITGNEIELKDVILQNGHLTIANDITASEVNVSNTSESKISINDITLNLEKLRLGNTATNEIDLSNSSLNFIGTQNEINFSGDLSIEALEVSSGNLEISSDLEIDNLILEGGTGIALEDGIEITLVQVSINSSNENRVSLSSEGSATLINNNSSKFCFDYIDIQNISVVGNTKFVYEGNSTNNGGEGWVNDDCENVLFAEFKLESACAGGSTFFFDESDGSPITWLWAFGDGSTSTEQNPVHIYSESGSYTVRLEVSNADETISSSRVVEVINSDIEIPIIEEQGGRLLTNSSGQTFQWYLDGAPIPNETSRLLSTSIGQGVYQVEVQIESCKALSEPYVITSRETLITQQVNIFPNPLEGDVLIITRNPDLVISDIVITDLTGKIVLQSIGLVKNSAELVTVNVPNTMKSGVYIIDLKLAQSQISLKYRISIIR